MISINTAKFIGPKPNVVQLSDSDQFFFNLLSQDEDQAFEWLFRTYFKELCFAVYRVLPDQHLSEDITQDMFYDLWRKRQQLNITSSLGAYLRRAVINRTLNHMRDNKLAPTEEPPENTQLNLADVTEELAGADLQESIDRAIDQLPDKCRMVFILSRFEELSYKEIADQLGIAEKTVENQVVKALKRLRISLKDYLE